MSTAADAFADWAHRLRREQERRVVLVETAAGATWQIQIDGKPVGHVSRETPAHLPARYVARIYGRDAHECGTAPLALACAKDDAIAHHFHTPSIVEWHQRRDNTGLMSDCLRKGSARRV